MHGNAGGSVNGGAYLASPNPCPGTGTFTASPAAVTFPSGAPSSPAAVNKSYYTYTDTTDPAYQANAADPALGNIHHSPNDTNIYFYPSMDYALPAECVPNSFMDWQDEFGVGNTTGQHLHFLVYSQSGGLTCSGDDDPSWWGIVYMPGGTVDTRGACGKKASVPWVTGQVIAKSFNTGGASSLTVYYRPCESGALCGMGPGTQLIQ
jgi:hypothetical protein